MVNMPTDSTGQDTTEVQLAEAEALHAALAQERVTSAQLALEGRQRELASLITILRDRYEEGGRYQLVGLDVARGVVTRREVVR